MDEVSAISMSFDSCDGHSVGANIRTLRRLCQKTLQQLADETGLSIGYLSQIERDKTSPSVKALHTVSRALGVNITWFFEASNCSQEEEYITRTEQRKKLHFNSGNTDFLLSRQDSLNLELLWCVFEPGSTSGDGPYEHTGEEAGVVITGEFALCINGQWYLLEAGDSFSFPSHFPHSYKNIGRMTTVVVWAITPPTY